MQIYIGKLFEQRFIKEKKMTKDELVAYDTDLLEELGQMKVKAKVRDKRNGIWLIDKGNAGGGNGVNQVIGSSYQAGKRGRERFLIYIYIYI